MLSTTKVGGVIEENNKAASVAFDGIFFNDCEILLDFFPPRIDSEIRNFLGKDLFLGLERRGLMKIWTILERMA